jgi:hypothetical protein
MAVNWLRKLANQAPVPVFPIVGRAGEAALEALYLSSAVTVAQSPKHARAAVVLGAIDENDKEAFRRVHDQVPAPRITAWFSTTKMPAELSASATVVEVSEDLGQRIQGAVQALDAGDQSGAVNLCPDQPPAPWKGVGDGMMGGKPYGRPMAMPEEDLRDGLQLDPLVFSIGPFSPLLPPGMVAKVTLHGDVIAGWELVSRPYERALPSVFYRAVDEPVAITELELARAAWHLRRLAAVLQLNGLRAHAQRLRHNAAVLQPGHSIAEVTNAGVLRSLRWVAGAGKGVMQGESRIRLAGPAARAAGSAKDARQNDPAYVTLGFEPIVQKEGSCASRWKQWLDEAEQALTLAKAAAKNRAMSSPSGAVESPVGPLTHSAPPLDCSDLLAPLPIGLEWSEAMSVLSSFDLPAVRYAGLAQAQRSDAV